MKNNDKKLQAKKTITVPKFRGNKKKLLDALEKSMGIVTTACKKSELSRQTYYRYMEEDAEFKKQAESVQDIALDFVESKLFENIQDKKEASIIFYMKTKGKKRGYIEKQEHDLNIKGNAAAVNITFGDIETENKK